MKRWLVARDEEGYHVRETLSVTHDGVRGEVVYHTKPRGTRKTLREALELARKLEKAKSAVKPRIPVMEPCLCFNECRCGKRAGTWKVQCLDTFSNEEYGQKVFKLGTKAIAYANKRRSEIQGLQPIAQAGSIQDRVYVTAPGGVTYEFRG